MSPSRLLCSLEKTKRADRIPSGKPENVICRFCVMHWKSTQCWNRFIWVVLQTAVPWRRHSGAWADSRVRGAGWAHGAGDGGVQPSAAPAPATTAPVDAPRRRRFRAQRNHRQRRSTCSLHLLSVESQAWLSLLHVMRHKEESLKYKGIKDCSRPFTELLFVFLNDSWPS